MRILLVGHYYLPWHQAGTELYTRALARKFRQEGHQVLVFASEDQAQAGFALKTDEYEGIKIFRLYHSEPFSFKSSYVRREFDQVFGRFLDQEKPDIVHFQHLLRLSLGFVEEARQRGIPALMTLADYWMLCPAIIMLKPEHMCCPGPQLGKACANCPYAMSAFYPAEASGRQSASQMLLERTLALAHRFKRRLPPAWVNWLRERAGKDEEAAERMMMLRERWKEMRDAVDKLSLLIAPSRFLLELMVKCQMVSPEKIVYSDYGFETEKFAKLEKGGGAGVAAGDSTFTLGFIGTLVRHKGLEVLIRAIKLIPEQNLDLKIYGEEKDFPGYVHELKKLAGKDRRIRWMGRVDNDRIPEMLEGIALLIVPSLWYENSPLTIHEAFLASVPVLASNLGGMAELVATGGGLTFQPGDPADLAKKIQDLRSDPQKLSALKSFIPRVKSINENYRELFEIYQKLAGNKHK